jgi:(E)-4-hydroxy-3-methylbut-2-enyl-diphosphate synthase
VLNFVETRYPELLEQNPNRLKYWEKAVLVLNTGHRNGYAEQRAFFNHLLANEIHLPVIVKREYPGIPQHVMQIRAAMDTGPLFIDGLAEGLWLTADREIEIKSLANISFGILQASRARMSKTEFISCPGCGRTLFDLQQTVAEVKARTGHLKGLKIAVMGCIVNGPGEMADADYGYIGAGPGKVHLYKNKEAMKKNIPETEAVEELVALIKREGDWRKK